MVLAPCGSMEVSSHQPGGEEQRCTMNQVEQSMRVKGFFPLLDQHRGAGAEPFWNRPVPMGALT